MRTFFRKDLKYIEVVGSHRPTFGDWRGAEGRGNPIVVYQLPSKESLIVTSTYSPSERSRVFLTLWFIGCATATVPIKVGQLSSISVDTAPTGGVNVLRKLWGEFLRTRAMQVKTVNARIQGEDRRQQ